MIKKFIFLMFALGSSFSFAGEQYYWRVSDPSVVECTQKFTTGEELGNCVASRNVIKRNYTTSYGGDCSGSYSSFVPENFTFPFRSDFISGYGYINVSVNCPSYTHPVYGFVSALHQNTQHSVSVQSYRYLLGASDDKPPPKDCAGNPVEIGTGIKIQREDDLIRKGIGQVELTRYYNAGNWRHTYQRYVRKIETVDMQHTSRGYTGKANACTSGWSEIKNSISASWAVNASAVFENDTCSVIKNGVVVRNLLLKDELIEPSTVMDGIHISRQDGSVITIQNSGNSAFKSLTGDTGRLTRVNSGDVMWRYYIDGEIEEYSDFGRLLSITAANGVKQTLTYDSVSGLLTKVQESLGGSLQLNYTGAQLTSVVTNDNKITSYTYNTSGLITQVKRSDNTTRKYHYEDTRFPKYLTGITDERNVRYATWAYDDKGRAISSEHAGGAEKTTLAFNADGSTTVTNALNKQTIYRFADIAGARRVTSVEGQPTTNCVGANQNYTYTSEGWIESKTDWKGNKTFYKYNTKGQEISRTEAYGTALAKSITTEWHATLNVKTKVTEPDRETVYTYDGNGLLLNQNTKSLL